jgi:hypothetical protein
VTSAIHEKKKVLSLRRVWQEAETGNNDVKDFSAFKGESCLSSDDKN